MKDRDIVLRRRTTTKPTTPRTRVSPTRVRENNHHQQPINTQGDQMKSWLISFLVVPFATSAFADPLLTSWATSNTAQYAYIRATTGATPVTTWTGQTLPAYSDIQKIISSTSNVYIYASGLASYLMGPWYLNAQKTMIFPN